MPMSGSVCDIIICRCPQNIIEISLSRKNVHRSMLSKKKRIKYIHQNLRYYETIEQIHFMVVK